MVRNLSTATKSATPTPFHHLLATLAQEGRLLRLYTQNVDGIDVSLPPLATQTPLPRKAPWPKTIQLHGSLEQMVCTKCHKLSDLNPELFDGPTPPPCQHCEETDGVRTQHAGKRSHGVGVLRPRMVLYNEHNPDDEAIGSVVKADLRTRPDALIVVGTTLKVPGVKRIVKEMCGIVRDRKDGVTVWINNDQPPAVKDFEWDLAVQGPCDYVASYAAMKPWDDPEAEEVSDEHIQKVKRDIGTIEVVVTSPAKNRTFDRVQGVPTPAASPKLKPQIVGGKSIKVAALKPKQLPTAGAKKNAEQPAATIKAQKKTAPKKKQSKAKNQVSNLNSGMRLDFKVSKVGAQPIPAKAVQAKPHALPQYKSTKAGIPDSDEFIMQPVSPSAARNNSNPPFQPPRKSYSDVKGVPLKVEIPNSSTPNRESPEERRRTITPPGPVPSGMANILHLG